MSVKTPGAVVSGPVTLFLGLVWLHPALGDEVITTNGDRLSGTILGTDADRILLETPYAGIIEIERGQVRSLHHAGARASLVAAEPPDAVTTKIADEPQLNEQDTTRAPAAEPSSTPARVGSARSSPFTPGSTLSGRASLALSSEKGNSEQDEVDIDLELGYRRGWHRLSSIGTFELDTNGGDKTTDKWSLNSRYSRHSPSRWYGAVWLAFKHDRFADLRLRSLGGPALGYLAFEGEGLNLSLEAGPMLLQDDFYGQPDQGFFGPGWFLNYEQLVWQGRLQPYHRQFGYLALDGEDKRLWQSWTGVRVPLADGFTGSIEFEYDYDSDPAVEAKTTDTTLRLKLGYQW